MQFFAHKPNTGEKVFQRASVHGCLSSRNSSDIYLWWMVSHSSIKGEGVLVFEPSLYLSQKIILSQKREFSCTCSVCGCGAFKGGGGGGCFLFMSFLKSKHIKKGTNRSTGLKSSLFLSLSLALFLFPPPPGPQTQSLLANGQWAMGGNHQGCNTLLLLIISRSSASTIITMHHACLSV